MQDHDEVFDRLKFMVDIIDRTVKSDRNMLKVRSYWPEIRKLNNFEFYADESTLHRRPIPTSTEIQSANDMLSFMGDWNFRPDCKCALLHYCTRRGTGKGLSVKDYAKSKHISRKTYYDRVAKAAVALADESVFMAIRFAQN